MKDFFRNLCLDMSAFVPMYILVLMKLVVELLNSNLSMNVLNTINLVTLVLLTTIGVWGLIWNTKFATQKAIKIKVVSQKNTTGNHFLGYFSLFVFFAIPLDLSLVSAYCVYILVLIMIGVVYITNSLYYINPLLNLLGFSFYDVEYVDETSQKIKTIKIFCRGRLKTGAEVWVKIKNENFCFVDRRTIGQQ